jgi:hypothetical protein
MADGTRRAIEDVKVGDKVASRNVTTGKDETHTVTRTFVHHDVALYEVKVDGGKVTTTADHPFYIRGKGWTAARDLRPGDELDQPDGAAVAVEAAIDTDRTATVYNFEVETTHDYYVQAGPHWALVHNDCVNWNPASRPTFGHTFSEHGAGLKNTRSLTDRARSTGQAQGQWLDNDAAAAFLRDAHLSDAGPRGVSIPEGLGQVIMPDGSIVPATRAVLVPSNGGLYKTAYPVVGP